MMMLEIKNIRVLLGGKKILDEFSLEVKNGEFLAILGKSGCGKSTLLKAVNGFVPCDDGSIYLNGACLDDVPIHKRGIAMVFQDVRLFPHLSVLENVAFGLKMQRVSREDRKKTALQWLERVSLSGYENRRTHELSGGQQQRVALARAYASGPEILLLDEPFSGLDEALREEMGTLLTALHKKSGNSIVFVTHDKNEAERLSDRVFVMDDNQNI